MSHIFLFVKLLFFHNKRESPESFLCSLIEDPYNIFTYLWYFLLTLNVSLKSQNKWRLKTFEVETTWTWISWFIKRILKSSDGNKGSYKVGVRFVFIIRRLLNKSDHQELDGRLISVDLWKFFITTNPGWTSLKLFFRVRSHKKFLEGPLGFRVGHNSW